MESQQSQQSLVRTDYTLKYYQLESMLQSSQFVRLTGEECVTFSRSWADYAEARGDVVFNWLAGNFADFLARVNQSCSTAIECSDSLLAFLKDPNADNVVFVIDASKVKFEELNKLLVVTAEAKNHSDGEEAFDSSRVFQSEGLQSNENDVANQSFIAGQLSKPPLPIGGIILLCPKTKLLKGYKRWFKKHTANLNIGAVQKAGAQQAPRFKYLISLLFVSVAVAVWQFDFENKRFDSHLSNVLALIESFSLESVDSEKNEEASLPIKTEENIEPQPVNDNVHPKTAVLKEAIALLLASTNSQQSDETANVERGLMSSSGVDANLEQKTDSRIINSENKSLVLDDMKPLPMAKKVMVIEESAVKVENVSVESSIIQELVVKPGIIDVAKESLDDLDNIIVAQTVDKQLNPERNQLPQETEQVEIVQAPSVDVVKVDSSLRAVSENQDKSAAASIEADKIKVEIIQATADIDADRLKAKENPEEKIAAAINGWVNAWQSKKYLDYSQFYISNYKSNGRKTHASWLKWRKSRIEKPKWIKLSHSDIKYLFSASTDVYQVTFTLSYASPNYRDDTLKKLTFSKQGESYKIIREENLKVTKL